MSQGERTMSNDNNNASMDPAVFEQFLREIHDRLGDFEVDKSQTTNFLNEAIKQINEQYGGMANLDLFEAPPEEYNDE